MVLVGHNLVADLSMLVRNGLPIPPATYFCTETAAQWLYPDQPDRSLEHLALRMTSVGQWRSGIGRLKPEDFDRMSDEALAVRCGGDAGAALALYKPLLAALTKAGLGPVWALAMRVLPILAKIGGTGMALDSDTLARRAADTGKWLTREKLALEQALGITNLHSGVQLAGALYGPQVRAVPLKRTEKHTRWSTDYVSLLWARRCAEKSGQAGLVSLLDRLIAYDRAHKLTSTYYTKWGNGPGQGRRVYSVYSLGRTATGRLASSHENLQNVPDTVRELVVPSPGYDCLLQADAKQLELCIAADLSQDPNLLAYIRSGRDLHALTAARALGLALPGSSEEDAAFRIQHSTDRDTGKMVNFSTIFDVSAETLSWQIFKSTEGRTYLTPSEVQAYIDAFGREFRGWSHYRDRLWARLVRAEPIRSKTGRVWQLPTTPEGLRASLNYPVQSLASDVILIILDELATRITTEGLRARLIGEVHDAFVLETVREDLPRLTRLIRQLFETPNTSPFGFQLSVPLSVEFMVGPSWGALAPVGSGSV